MRMKWARKEQRRINKKIWDLNMNIRNDPLWKGRFYVRQRQCSYKVFEDGSGGLFNLYLELRDRKTEKIKAVFTDNYNLDWTLFKEMNDFIIYDCKVWEEMPKISYENTPDYRNEHF